jgi:O-antigen/teichoic acid export membrane protein
MLRDRTDTLPPRAGRGCCEQCRGRSGGRLRVNSDAGRSSDRPNSTHVLDLPTAGGRVIRGTLLRTLAYGAGVLLGIVAAALLTRHLGAADFGRYITVVSVIAVAAGLSDAGLLNVGVREYSVREGDERDRLLRNLFGIRLVVTGVGTALALAFSFAAGYGSEMVLGTAFAGLALLATTFQQTLAVPLSSELRLGWLSILDVFRQVATVIAVVALVLAGAELLPFLAAQLPVALVVLGATVLLVRHTVSLRPAFVLGEWFRLARVVLPYAAANAVGVLYGSLAIILLSLISTPDETGYFGAAFRVFLVLAGIPTLLVTSAFPILARAARDDHARLAYASQRLWDISLIVGTGLALAALVGAPLAIDLVAGAQFAPSVDVLRVQAAALIPSFVFGVWGFALLALARYRGLLIANGIALLASAAITLALASPFGAFGAAFATLAGDTCLAVGYAIVLMRGHREFRVSLELVPRVALACGFAACALLIPGLPEIGRLVLAVAAYVAALVALRAIPEEIPQALRSGRQTVS